MNMAKLMLIVVLSYALGLSGCVKNSIPCIDVLNNSDAEIRGVCFAEGIIETRPVPGVAYVRTSENLLIGLNARGFLNIKEGDKVSVVGKYFKMNDFVHIDEIIEISFSDE